jgi:N utilization substance protein B
MNDKSSLKARLTAARLFAVQAVYQAIQNKVAPNSLYDEYILHRIGMDLNAGDGAETANMVQPDGTLFRDLLSGVTERWDDLQNLVKPRLSSPDVEPILTAILVCGTYELLAHSKTDTPIIISDYLDITNGFFTGSESRLVNGVLDAIAKELRG